MPSKKRHFFYKCQNQKLIYKHIRKRTEMKRKLKMLKEGPNLEETQLYDRITKTEAQILEKIQKLKTNPKTFICEHFSINSPDCEPYDNNVNYYDKFWKRFLLNEIGKQNLVLCREQLDIFSKKINKVQTLFDEWEKMVGPMAPQKKRETKIQEGESQLCPFCKKCYRDEETLLIHIKVKHNEIKSKPRSQKNEFDIFESDNLL